jgi:4-aminobutyrate aminotransferase-like enzyme/Ser/Thr protein kinase RdoA (MazF antagonist)
MLNETARSHELRAVFVAQVRIHLLFFMSTTISSIGAAGIALDRYGLHAQASRLDGEYDANFRLDADDGSRYLLRISHPDELRSNIEFQNALLTHLHAAPAAPFVQRLIAATDGQTINLIDTAERRRFVRLFSWLEGRLMAHAKPHLPEFLHSFGRMLGIVDAALAGFDHAGAHRDLKWDLSKAEWISADVNLIDDAGRRDIVQQHVLHYMSEVQPRLAGLRRSVIHNDANDYNVLVSGVGYDAQAAGLIDFGDAMFAPTVCNLAIALAYAMLDKPDPVASAARIVRGYHAAFLLTETELEVLYPLAVMRLCVSVVNSARRKREHPEDAYVVVSEAPAWRTLERLQREHPRLAHYKLRQACGLEPVPHAPAVRQWLAAHAHEAASVVAPDLRHAPVSVFDLSAGSLELGLPDEYDTTAKFTRLLFSRMDAEGADAGIGQHDEARLIYKSDDFATQGEHGVEDRTVHVGFDVFQPAGAPVYAAFDGIVHSVADNDARLDYGPCIILQHTTSEGVVFYTLYGHLSRESLEGLSAGMSIQHGQQIATMGDFPINGDWPPHLHFQVIADLLDYKGTFPGVARASDRAVWRSLCPDPNLIVGVPASRFPSPRLAAEEILSERQQRVGRNLSISYRHPLHIVRGAGPYLFNADGRRFIDFYNNVPHVGHNHPHVVRAAQRQMAVLNTNTRYLHGELTRYARRLTERMPGELKVCFFVASGSEATELSLRLARAFTKQRDLIVSEGAYHGHTTTLIDISPYKAEGPGGAGLPPWVHKADVPDVYRGKYRHDDVSAGLHYAQDVQRIIDGIHAQGRGLCGFIIESVPSVGGQIVLPDAYLPAVYASVRKAGGVCIADEVQTGFGRLGTHFWAFERYGVTPDIVALGKPIGNGYPMGAVITTPAIAAAFDNGMEFFSTFGGSTAACAVGNAVLDVIEREGLQAHALEVGVVLAAKLRGLMSRHVIVGDVRGGGLMLGLELVNDRETLSPAAQQASYIANRMQQRGVLIGTDGIHHNILKIRGPLCLTREDVDVFVRVLDEVLEEDGAMPDSKND